jgi:DNA invertase Pin-like site-specific DNA recombinase
MLQVHERKLTVAVYCRVSTDKSDQLNSLENQRNFFRELKIS